MANVFGLDRKKSLDFPSLLVKKVERHHLEKLLMGSASRVITRSVENMRLLLDEAKEAYRELRKRERYPNHYQVYTPRS